MSSSKQSPFLIGDNLDLYPLNSDHVYLYSKWENNPKVRRYARTWLPVSIKDSEKYLETRDKGVPERIMLEIQYKKDNKPVGYCEIGDFDWFDRRAYIGFLIGETEYWGKNICSEAVKLLVEYCFTELNLFKITAETLAPNIASKRCLEKNGFKIEGKVKKEMYVDGEFLDMLKLCIFKDDWMKSKK
ncbi:MAG: GNAT family N-acetyltransferase [Candidatus Heimdallarchaeota archaeon]